MEQKTVDMVTLTEALRVFARERDWEKFHSPKNLAMALCVEASELLEHFQWLTESESAELTPETRSDVTDEMADVLLYLVMLADKLGIDLGKAATEKLEKNRARYPADRVRGKAEKAPPVGRT